MVKQLSVYLLVAFAGLATDGARPRLTNDDIESLVRAGFGESLILHAIGANASGLDVTPNGLSNLRRAGVGENIISAMAGAVQRPATHLRLLDAGVYYKRSEAYSLVDPEIIEWKGTIISADNFSRVKLVGELGAERSRLWLTRQCELLLVCDIAESCSNYQIVRAHVQTASRLFQAEAAVRNGEIVALGSADKTALFTAMDRTFDLGVRVPLSSLAPGEYGLIQPDMIENGRIGAGRIYSFTIE